MKFHLVVVRHVRQRSERVLLCHRKSSYDSTSIHREIALARLRDYADTFNREGMLAAESRGSVRIIAASAYYGLCGNPHNGYVARWAKDRVVLKRNLDAIQKTASRVIEGIKGAPREVSIPPSCDHQSSRLS